MFSFLIWTSGSLSFTNFSLHYYYFLMKHSLDLAQRLLVATVSTSIGFFFKLP